MLKKNPVNDSPLLRQPPAPTANESREKSVEASTQMAAIGQFAATGSTLKQSP